MVSPRKPVNPSATHLVLIPSFDTGPLIVRTVRDALAHPVEDAEEPLRAVRPAHRLEDAVGAGL